MKSFLFKGQTIQIHESWAQFFGQQAARLVKIETQIGDDFTPSADKIFTIFKMPLQHVKFVIVGQDPYPQPNVATGRSFEIAASSWQNVNTSLQSILCSLFYQENNQFLDYPEVLKRITNRHYNIDSPNAFFKNLEQNFGVFFLNKSLTTAVNQRNAHEEIWDDFTKNLVVFINDNVTCTWFLWGERAQALSELILDKSTLIETIHPNKWRYVESPLGQLELKKQFSETSGLERFVNRNLSNNTIKIENMEDKTYIGEGHYRGADGTEFMSIWTFKRKHQISGGNNSEEALQMQNFNRFRGPFTQSLDYKSGYMYDVSQLKEFYNI